MRNRLLHSTVSTVMGISLVLAATTVSANHDLILTIAEGVELCDISGSTYAVGSSGGGFEVKESNAVTSVTSGSCMWVDLDLDSTIDITHMSVIKAAGGDLNAHS